MNANRSWMLPLELEQETSPPASASTAPNPVFIATPSTATEEPLRPTQDESEEESDSYPLKQPGSLWKWFAWPASLLLIGIMIEEMVTFLLAQYRIHPSMAIIFGCLLALMLGTLLTAIIREFSTLRAIRQFDSLRHYGQELLKGNSFGLATPLLDHVIALYRERPEMRPALERFHASNQPHLHDHELLALFSAQAMQPLDQAALRIIGRNAASTALFTAITPLAILDVVIFFWRNIRMTREIAHIYGLRPGLTGSLILMRHVAEGMLAAGVGEIATTSLADTLGDALAGAALAGAGQAVSNALFTARTGLQTMQQCRPIPFPATQKPGFGQIRQEFKSALVRTPHN
ncbi:MAG: DUF697 domain-containing protein [Magnetococcales bacterium]|nr:DUF697 domain-containing protein [Magnetococcales bacterium]MBF0439903.1 DUF697 domain-containing protein [Magnetococcales bacterium]